MTDQRLVRWKRKPVADPEQPVLVLQPTPDAAALAKLEPIAQEARKNLEFKRAPRTLEAYEDEFKRFEAWCAEHGLPSLPTTHEVLALYVAYLGTFRSPNSIGSVVLASIAWHHRQARHESPHRHPDVLDQVESLRRRKGTRRHKKTPLTSDLLARIVAPLGDSIIERRDRALLLIGFSVGFRRSALVSLQADPSDLVWAIDGVMVFLRRDKTDQTGEGRWCPIAHGDHPPDACPAAGTCPVGALRAWLDEAGITAGPIWRPLDPARAGGDRAPEDALRPGTVAAIVKARCAAVGIDPENFAGHSMRSGLATSAARAGRTIFEIMDTIGWKSADVAASYVREAQGFKTSAARGLL